MTGGGGGVREARFNTRTSQQLVLHQTLLHNVAIVLPPQPPLWRHLLREILSLRTREHPERVGPPTRNIADIARQRAILERLLPRRTESQRGRENENAQELAPRHSDTFVGQDVNSARIFGANAAKRFVGALRV